MREVTVTELELAGRRLAVTTTFAVPSGGGIHQGSLRLADVRTGRSREVAFQVTGLSGQSLVGASFAGGRLGWYLSCLGDPSGCRSAAGAVPGAMTCGTGRYDHAADARARPTGSRCSRDRRLRRALANAERCTDPPGEPAAAGCEVALAGPVRLPVRPRAAPAPLGASQPAPGPRLQSRGP